MKDEEQGVNSYTVRDEEAIRRDLSNYLKRHEQKDTLRLLVAGSVDDGKSTLIGRLLYDSHLIYQDHLNALYQDSNLYYPEKGKIDFSLLTDGLRAEREQGITIDVAYRYFSTEKRSFIICDAPGHEQYTRNMATGASHCDLALILVDATRGINDQTRRHSLIATLMGIRQIIVVINKMDLAGYEEKTFKAICEQYLAFSGKLNISSLSFIPVSALEGDNIVDPSVCMPWYQGAPLLNNLEDTNLMSTRNLTNFRFPVQYIIRSESIPRGYAGSIASGVICKGDLVTVLPSRVLTHIKTVETFEGCVNEAFTPMPVVLTTTDEVDISRGDMLVKTNDLPFYNNKLETVLLWFDETHPLQSGNQYLLKCATQCVPAKVHTIHDKYNLNELTQEKATSLLQNDIGHVGIRTMKPLLFDTFAKNSKTGSFILIDRNSFQTCAGGIIIESGKDSMQEKKTSGSENVTIWLTGLSGAGKSTIAKEIRNRFIETGINACILDGDELRLGLNSNLGFSPDDRKENVRRTAEVAKLFNNSGFVSIVAMISPYKADRMLAANIIGEKFVEVFVEATIDTCRERDPKGLYKKVNKGEIAGFTGIDAPYEKPDNPDIIVNTELLSIEDAVTKIINYLKIFPYFY